MSVSRPEPFLAKLGGAEGNPYENLEVISGVGHTDPVIAAIGRNTVEAQQRVLEKTLLVPGRSGGDANDVIDGDLLAKHFSSDPEAVERTFVIPPDGTSVHVTSPRWFTQIGFAEALGTADTKIYEMLDSRQNRLIGLEGAHNNRALELANLPKGGTLIDFGAGRDWKRMDRFKEHAEEKRGRFLAHDVVPALARIAGKERPGIPYLSLPPYDEFVSPALAERGPSLTITMKDVLSSMSFSNLREFWEIVKKTGARKVVASQSLSIAPTSAFIAHDFLYEKGLDQFCGRVLTSDLKYANLFFDLLKAKPELQLFAGAFIKNQIRKYIELISFEFLCWHFARIGKEIAGFEAKKSFSSNATTVEDGASYVKQFLPDKLEFFESGEFNSVEFSPFDIKIGKERGVPNGQLKVSSLQMHISMGKSEAENSLKRGGKKLKKGRRTRQKKGGSSANPLGLLSEKNFSPERFIHYSPEDIMLLMGASANIIDPADIPFVKSAVNVPELRRHLMIATIELVANEWGTGAGFPQFDTNAFASKEAFDAVYFHLKEGIDRV